VGSLLVMLGRGSDGLEAGELFEGVGGPEGASGVLEFLGEEVPFGGGEIALALVLREICAFGLELYVMASLKWC
jgi:hypothetical protein